MGCEKTIQGAEYSGELQSTAMNCIPDVYHMNQNGIGCFCFFLFGK